MTQSTASTAQTPSNGVILRMMVSGAGTSDLEGPNLQLGIQFGAGRPILLGNSGSRSADNLQLAPNLQSSSSQLEILGLSFRGTEIALDGVEKKMPFPNLDAPR
jgi:hypothetical protein